MVMVKAKSEKSDGSRVRHVSCFSCISCNSWIVFWARIRTIHEAHEIHEINPFVRGRLLRFDCYRADKVGELSGVRLQTNRVITGQDVFANDYIKTNYGR